MRTYTMEQIQARALERPEGYLADVLSYAERDGNVVRLPESAYRKLRRKYNPPSPWPMSPFGIAMRAIRPMAIVGELGVGDTLARLIGPIGGEAYKQWFENKFGRTCGCTERQAQLNKQYPYV